MHTTLHLTPPRRAEQSSTALTIVVQEVGNQLNVSEDHSSAAKTFELQAVKRRPKQADDVRYYSQTSDS